MPFHDTSENDSTQPTDAQMQTAWSEGKTAFKNGKIASHNPHPVSTVLFFAWQRGYEKEAQDFIKQNPQLAMQVGGYAHESFSHIIQILSLFKGPNDSLENFSDSSNFHKTVTLAIYVSQLINVRVTLNSVNPSMHIRQFMTPPEPKQPTH